MLHRVKTSDPVGQRTHPDLATLLPDHLPVLHHMDGTQVDRVVRFVPQPVLVTLMDGERRQGRRRDEIRVRSAAHKRRKKKIEDGHLLDGGDRDDEEERQPAGDGTGGCVDDQLKGKN